MQSRKNLRDTFRDMTPDEMREASREAEIAEWSLVAGFVDPGESLEDAIRREVREEASIEVKDIRYFGSIARAMLDAWVTEPQGEMACIVRLGATFGIICRNER